MGGRLEVIIWKIGRLDSGPGKYDRRSSAVMAAIKEALREHRKDGCLSFDGRQERE